MKFIHTGDIHLGAAPDAGMPWSRKRSREIWDTFYEIIRRCGEEKIDLLLIAGDLFHALPTQAQLEEVNAAFAAIPGTRVVLMAGNHDFICRDNPAPAFPWAENVAGLFERKMECIRFPEIRTEVYGFSYHSREIKENLYAGLHPVGGNYFHILLAHCGDASHIPVTVSSMAETGFDYIAMGHIHKGGALIENRALWCGAPEPIDSADTGAHGYILGEVVRGRLKTKFVPCAKRSYKELIVESDVQMTSYSMADYLQEAIRREGAEDIYRVILTGQHKRGIRFDTQMLMECGNILEVQDQTHPYLDVEKIRQSAKGTIIEEYIDSFDDEDDDPAVRRALILGLEALLAAGKENGNGNS